MKRKLLCLLLVLLLFVLSCGSKTETKSIEENLEVSDVVEEIEENLGTEEENLFR